MKFGFSARLLDARDWLTADETTGKVFCYCCLLFGKGNTVWSDPNKGFDQLHRFTQSLKKHEGVITGKGKQSEQCSHKKAEIDWRRFLVSTNHLVPGTLPNMNTRQVISYYILVVYSFVGKLR